MTSVLLRVGGASQPSEEEADSEGDRSAHRRLILEAARKASRPSERAADEEDEDSSGESRHVLRREFDGEKLDERELALDYREALLEVREAAINQRLSQLEPSNQEGERAKNEAEEKTREAIKALQSAEEAGGGEALGEARRLLEASCTKSAASAVMVVADVAKNCEKEVRCAVKAAERTVRDVLVMRCRCQAVPGDKDSFLETVEQAFGRPLDQKLKAVVLLSYHKITRDKPNKFLSKNQMENARRGGPRRRRERGTSGDAPAGPVPEDSGGAAEVTPEAKSAEVFNSIDSFWAQNYGVTGFYDAAYYMEAPPWEYPCENHFEIECAPYAGWGNA